jgi:hypothetical protein
MAGRVMMIKADLCRISTIAFTLVLEIKIPAVAGDELGKKIGDTIGE